METNKELNSKLKEEINKVFEELFKKIGNNRQQLANKVIGVHKEINKELTKTKVDEKRETEIRREVASIEKMAAQQLPHLDKIPVRTPMPPVARPVVAKAAAPVAPKAPAPIAAKTPAAGIAKTPAPIVAKAPAPAKAKPHTTVKTKAQAPAKAKKKKK